jgi:hypothetical protein
MVAQRLAHNVETARQWRIRERLFSPTRPSLRMVATSDFSGLTSSPWALARAEANVPIEGLDLRMAVASGTEEVETDRS